MQILSTLLSKADLIKLLEANSVIPNSCCMAHLKSGKTYFIPGSSYNEKVAYDSGCFIMEDLGEHEVLNIQLHERPNITGNLKLCPFI